ncbi:hypothetical protein [Clostridioides difficile]|uniref:hypothetical protein n=1 Tax=Clostridioides difficile TaxID=1496 RepID=UPI001C1A1291|nr:hypothetical protein [Clostridioides difficile]HBF6291362.1 hypothetical protein [Clostridioides difficile]HBG4071408.1 hypothetical protein [Clostridioides difficile]HBY2690090.1 hypothetical protein [Clostridioides difficile]HDO9121442.1 hypothetical protein [Clostridioides difficile]
MEETILKDIRRIQEGVRSLSCAERLQNELVAKYRGEIDHIDKDLDHGYVDFYGNGNDIQPDYMGNLNNIKGKLEVLLAKTKDEKSRPKDQPTPLVNVTNTSSSDNHSNNTNNLSNTNSNTVDIKLLFVNARKNIEDDTSLNDVEYEEILNRINELEEIHNSDESTRSKWGKSKQVMSWLLEKGPKIASTFLPLIQEVIKQ